MCTFQCWCFGSRLLVLFSRLLALWLHMHPSIHLSDHPTIHWWKCLSFCVFVHCIRLYCIVLYCAVYYCIMHCTLVYIVWVFLHVFIVTRWSSVRCLFAIFILHLNRIHINRFIEGTVNTNKHVHILNRQNIESERFYNSNGFLSLSSYHITPCVYLSLLIHRIPTDLSFYR